ncbi:Fur family transcriptional regulator [Demequina muriae]|uniref:Fur family transcriptional regulator n=1 Tax=Demequina muriae TaxID=3051664 RepID=A0ABT8GGG6_9MICO|nr:Fur family transcriptional regulator [Demequina sp. EGI L300058]MDN4480520.1 Fur family transcriptional regulator [Demequina sp. EGI L300058]
MSTPPPPADTLLRESGLRVTQPRLSVMKALGAQPHASADAIFERVREFLPSTSLQAVYNVLGDLVAAGLVRRIEPAGHPGLFELRVGDNHHHIVCKRCGTVADVDCVTGHAPCLTPSDSAGFDLSEAEVTFWGVCADCATASAVPPGLATNTHA